jgi:AP-2 complex subunit mu-1
MIGDVLKADVTGRVQVKAELTGMPECKFGMNDKFILQRDKKGMIEQGINIDDLKFDRCVKLSKFDKERAITFIPPDSTFDLMTYRISENVNLPFRVLGNYQQSGPFKFDFDLKLKAVYDQQYSSTTVVVKIPCPKTTIDTNSNVQKGRAKHEPDQQAIMWRIKKFQGGSETMIRGTIDVSQDGGGVTNWQKPPIELNFSVIFPNLIKNSYQCARLAALWCVPSGFSKRAAIILRNGSGT